MHSSAIRGDIRARRVGRLAYRARVTRLDRDAYLSAVRSESDRFREVLGACDPDARVPGCPDWSAADLLWHLATVQRWWAEVVAARPARPEQTDPPRPTAYADLLARFDQWSAELSDALVAAAPQEQAWNWSDDHTVGFILRRQAHEALVHRVDAEQAAGVPSTLDARLAADGVHECLDVMYGGCPPWGTWTPGESTVRIDATDTSDQVWVRFGTFSGTDPDSGRTYEGEEDFHVVEAPADPDEEPDVVVDGPAAALDLWLWDRGDDADLSVVGDRAVVARFRDVVGSPIN